MNGYDIRRLLKRTALTVPLIIGATTGHAAAQTGEQPDVIVFVADDLTRADIGAYGSVDARTPNIDQLAKDGIRFTNAFASSPSCSPSRASIYTGLYPMRHGAHANHSSTSDGVRSMPAYLHKLGYRVVIAGKTHVGPRRLYPFEYMPASVIRPEGRRGSLWSQLNVEAIDELLATRDRRKPLALIVNAFAPHTPWPASEDYDAARLTVPANQVDTPVTRGARARYLSRVTQADHELGAVRASIIKYGRAANTLLLFTADQGAQFPFGKWNLYDSGIAAPLIGVWPDKIAAGSKTDAMVSLIDILPTMQEAGGGKPEQHIDGCSFLPLLRGKAAGCHGAEVFAAHSGMPGSGPTVNIAPMRAIRTERYKLIVNFRPDLPYVTPVNRGGDGDGAYWASWVDRAKNDRRAAFLVNRYETRPAIELYDLQADPLELQNLAGAPAHKQTVTALHAKLTTWMVSQGEDPDNVKLPDTATRGNYPYAQ